MRHKETNKIRTILIWGALTLAITVPVAASLMSPLLAWREPVYIVAALAGIIAMALLLVQPLMIGRYMPGVSVIYSRQIHRWIGSLIFMAVIVHVGGLWITTPPDVIDALLFASPTSFSVWGVLAMWAVFLTGVLALLRKRMKFKPNTWRVSHSVLVAIIVVGTVVHAVLIEGTMEPITKTVLCAILLLATARVFANLFTSKMRMRARRNTG